MLQDNLLRLSLRLFGKRLLKYEKKPLRCGALVLPSRVKCEKSREPFQNAIALPNEFSK